MGSPVANPLPLIALASYDLSLVDGTAFSMTNQDPEHPATKLGNGNPADVAKSLTDTTTVSITTDSSAVRGVALINTNAIAATVNGQTVVIPALDYDGQRIHGWGDFRLAELGPTTGWSIALTAAGGEPVWIGHIALLIDLLALNLKYGLKVGETRPGDTLLTTRLGSTLRSGAQIRTRWARGIVDLEADELTMRSLYASARGSILPMVLIPDEAKNDAWLVYLSSSLEVNYPDYGIRPVPLAFDEISGGPPNG